MGARGAVQLLVVAALINLSVQKGVNLALNQATIQSSYYVVSDQESPPSYAVDGIFFHTYVNPNYPCTNTANETQPWWAVDLGAVTSVSYVIISVRGDCCLVESSDFVVGVTNVSPWTTPPPHNTQGPNVCAYYPGTPALGSNNTIYCAPTTSPGRYLYVKKMDKNELSLCEVQVYGSVAVGPNLALNKLTIQSSTQQTYVSANGVDGLYGYSGGTYQCAETTNEDQPWWAVDLGAVTSVLYVIINVRSDCCNVLTANFVIGMTNVSPWTTQPPMVDQGPPCAYVSGSLALGANTTISCNPDSSPGRYLFLKRSDKFFISFCEIQVFAALPVNQACPGAGACQASQSSGCGN